MTTFTFELSQSFLRTLAGRQDLHESLRLHGIEWGKTMVYLGRSVLIQNVEVETFAGHVQAVRVVAIDVDSDTDSEDFLDDGGRAFVNWINEHKHRLMPTGLGPAVDGAWGTVHGTKPDGSLDVRQAKAAECPECWGTGYYRGSGGPCRKGCKP